MSYFLRGVITNAYYHENNITGIGINCHKNANGLTFHKYMKVEACHNKNVKFVFDKICIQNVHASHVSRPFKRHVKVVFSNSKFKTTKIRHFTRLNQDQYPFICIRMSY